MNTKNIVIVVLIIVIVGLVGYFYNQQSETGELTNTTTEENVDQEQDSTVTPEPERDNDTVTFEPDPEDNTVTPEPDPEPEEETNTYEDVVDQDAYLVGAYSENGKNYIKVDYIDWLRGDERITAMIDDGICENAESCSISETGYMNGYKRNVNPLIRTIEVSPTAEITTNGFLKYLVNKMNGVEATHSQPITISFEKLVTILIYENSISAPDAEIDILVQIDIENGVIEKITEPFQS